MYDGTLPLLWDKYSLTDVHRLPEEIAISYFGLKPALAFEKEYKVQKDDF